MGVAVLAKDLKIGVFTDIHLNTLYDATISSETYCQASDSENSLAKVVANFGRFGCDPPQLLLETMFKIMKEEHADLDVLLVPGDIVGHPFPEDITWGGGNYPELLNILATVGDLFTQYFPDVVVLPAFGNNDSKYHY